MTTRKPGKWKVMGRDTFAREDYLVRAFATQQEARDFVRARQAAVEQTQDEDVRDEFWIVPPE
jgi:hypothetical protein